MTSSKGYESARARKLQAARTITCKACQSVFCPLYGHSHAVLCGPCRWQNDADQRARYRKAWKAKARARRNPALA